MSSCECKNKFSSLYQTLDELEFERGIWYAAQNNDMPRVQELLAKNKDVNGEDNSGYTALHYASRNGHFEMCKLLITNGANVNALTKCGKVSPLHRCCSMGHTDIFKLLLKSGAAVGLKDGDGKTILHRAVEGGHINLVNEILKIEPTLKNEADSKGKLPEEYIKESTAMLDAFKTGEKPIIRDV